MNLTVAVVSFGRPGEVLTDRIVRGAKIVVPESQVDAYLKGGVENGGEFWPCPDEIDGNVSRKRNWVLDNCEGAVLLLDDDIQYIGRIQGGKVTQLDLDEVERLIWEGFEMCRDLGTVMWGLNQQADPKFYREYTPFCLLSPVLGPWQGFLDTPLRYDEELWLKEDYDMWLHTVRRYRRTLRFNMYHYMAGHISNAGGVVSQRSMEEERKQVRRLQRRWGSRVVTVKPRSINPTVRVPIRGV